MQFQTQLKIALLLGMGLLSSNTYAQAVEKIYAANSCDTGTDDVGMPATTDGIFYNDGNQSITRRFSFDSNVTIICPVTRQKIGSASGAKFSMFVRKTGVSDVVNCTMTSRRPHNGALVSSGSRSTSAAAPIGDYRLVRSIAPSSTFGPYSLTCEISGLPRMYTYIIREF